MIKEIRENNTRGIEERKRRGKRKGVARHAHCACPRDEALKCEGNAKNGNAYKFWRLVRLPKADGIVPVRLLLLKCLQEIIVNEKSSEEH